MLTINWISNIKGQCTQALLAQIKSNPLHNIAIASDDLLKLKVLIERTTIITKTDTLYTFAIVYEEEVALFDFQQNLLNLTNTTRNSAPRLVLESRSESREVTMWC